MSPACNTCAWVFPGCTHCLASPEGAGIPDAIATGRHHHTTPVEGDHGYRYAPALGPKPRFCAGSVLGQAQA
jgi:hypothetical protein